MDALKQSDNRLIEHAGSSLIEQMLVGVLILLFFLVGYLWSGSGHDIHTAWHARTWLDDRIPLVPVFILFYMLGYVFVFLPLFMLRGRRDFEAGVAVFVGMLSVAFLCFHFFPVYMYKLAPSGQDALSTLTRYQQSSDVPYNNLPSLHVSLNLFAWMLFFHQARTAALWWLPLLVCIVLSTLLVKQHLVVDAIGGVLLASAGFVAWCWLRQRDAGRCMYWLALLLAVAVLLFNEPRISVGIRTVTGLLEKAVGF